MWGLFLFISCFSVQVLATEECGSLGAAPGEYLVRWKSTPGPSLLSSKTTPAYKVKKWIHTSQEKGLFAKAFSQTTETAPLSLHEKLKIADVEELKNDANVLSVEPNCYREIVVAPNDTYLNTQWGLQVTETQQAWDRTVGTSTVTVGVSDTGIDYTHEDLRDQMWVNTAERDGSFGVDDDGNGCVDDVYGCDLGSGDGDPMPSSDPIGFHGTHVAGIIGARPNNGKGISGVAWKVKLIAAKGFSDETMTGTIAALIDSIYYAANNGARVINCSWGGLGVPSSAERDAVVYARNRGAVVVVAAGNDGKDASTYTPASIIEVLTVGSINKNSQYSTFSNYGYGLDLLAPGGDIVNGSKTDLIYSTAPGNIYRGEVGTSMAAPFVSGVAALVLSINAALSVSQVEGILFQSATPTTLTNPNSNQSYNHLIVNTKRAVEMALATLPPGSDPNVNPGNNCDPNQDQNCVLDLSSQLGNSKGQAEMAGCGRISSTPRPPSSPTLLLLILFLPLITLLFSRYRDRHLQKL